MDGALNLFSGLTLKNLSRLAAVAALVALGCSGAFANVQVHLEETFGSGATFSGNLTFDDDFTMITGVTGTISGGLYASFYAQDPIIDHTYFVGSNMYSGAYYFNRLLSESATNAIGLVWTGSSIATLSAGDTADFGYYYAGVDDFDPLVTATFSEIPGAVPEPANAALLLGGIGLMGLIARRRKS